MWVAALALTACGSNQNSELNMPDMAPSNALADAIGGTPSGTPQATIDQAIGQFLQAGQKAKIGTHTVNLNQLRSLYQLRANQPAFVTSTGALPISSNLKMLFTQKAERHGLVASDYWFTDMNSRLTRTDMKSLIEVELLLSQSLIELADDLQNGRTNPQDTTQEIGDIELKKRTFTDFAGLNASFASLAFIDSAMESYAPQHLSYRVMIMTLQRLRAAKADGGWTNMVFAKKITPGLIDTAIPSIRRRLFDMGITTDPNERVNPSAVYDPALVAAVQKFQENQKLGTDGVIGKATFSALGASLDSRIDQVRANLERWRLLPSNLGDRYIIVDLNQQEFKLYTQGQIGLAMRVVVGRDERRTPTFMDQATQVIVNPYWFAPPSIVVKDILPKAVYDPSYFSQIHMRVFDSRGYEIDAYSEDWGQYSLNYPPPYTFREDPGDHNSLGRLKFNLSENRNSIYMHDTNHKELFKEQKRLFSSGCIRLEKPRDLAAYLLSEQGISRASVESMINDPTVIAKAINLNSPVRVYILGQSIAVDPDGSLRFGQDFYRQDDRIVNALDSHPVPGSLDASQPREDDYATPAPRPEPRPEPPYRPGNGGGWWPWNSGRPY